MLKTTIQEKILKNVKSVQPILLNNNSFKNGTFRIRKPGFYQLDEDIEFNPCVNDVFLPRKFDKKYPRNIYFLGFFAAITIECDYVELDLNYHKIEINPLFSLVQRFFSIIELANSPFIRDQGPTGSFDDNGIKCAKYVIIKGGCLGNSSHTSIHGNNNEYLYFENIVCKDFETGGIILNNGKNIEMNNIEIGPSNKKILANQTFFAFINIVRIIYTFKLNELKCKDPNILVFKEAISVYYKILENYKNFRSIIDVTPLTDCEKEDIYNKTIKQFKNNSGFPDGSAIYGLSFTPSGISIAEIGCCIDKNSGILDKSSNINLNDINIHNLTLNTSEITAMRIDKKIIRGAFGEVISTSKNMKFLSYLQFSLWDFLIKNPSNNIKTTFNLNIDVYNKAKMVYDKIVYKIKNPQKIHYRIVYGGDIMVHFNKGIIPVRIENVLKIIIKNINIQHIENLSKKTEYSICSSKNELIRHKNLELFDDFKDYIGCSIFGILSFLSKCIINNYNTKDLYSSNGIVCENIIL